MTDPKAKQSPTLREPKAKKKLGLSVPPPLRMPHEELVTPINAPTLLEVAPTIPSQTSQSSHTSQSSQSRLSSLTSHTIQEPKPEDIPVAPIRDFTRVANSISRKAVPAGAFRGKSKQLYDCLYSMTRGAIVPSRTIRISRQKLMKAAHIGSRVTFDANITHLCEIGLITVRPIAGEHEGNEYTVHLPEEIDLSIPSLTSQTSETSVTDQAQKVDRLVSPETSRTRHTLSSKESTASATSHTFFNTFDDDDDTHTLLQYFSKILLDSAAEIVGGKLTVTEQERVLWGECARVLADELRNAANNANAISSVPAFFTAHLRRRFAKKMRPSSGAKTTSNSDSTSAKTSSDRKEPQQERRSKFTLEQCRRYAQHLQTSGQGISNPGGYATMIYRTGEADELIQAFLNPPPQLDLSQCPDCQGSGWYYPQGVGAGPVKKCKHERLEKCKSTQN